MLQVRKNGSVLLSLALLGAGPIAAQTTPAANQPAIACTIPSYDFGRQANTTTVTHLFVITNSGMACLNIDNIDTGCGCTIAKMETNAIAPGGAAGLTVQFNTAGRSGPQHKPVYIRSNDRQNPVLRLALTGELVDIPSTGRPSPPVMVTSVADSLHVTPAKMDLGRVALGAPAEGQIVIAGDGTNAFQVTGFAANCSNLTVHSQMQTDRRWLLTVRLLPACPVGYGEAEIVINTSHPAMAMTRIPVSWRVESDLQAIPAEISLMASPATTNVVSRHVAVRSRSGRPFHVEAVELPNAEMKSGCIALASNEYRCAVQNIVPSTNLSGRAIVIRTDLANERAFVIPVHVASR